MSGILTVCFCECDYRIISRTLDMNQRDILEGHPVKETIRRVHCRIFHKLAIEQKKSINQSAHRYDQCSVPYLWDLSISIYFSPFAPSSFFTAALLSSEISTERHSTGAVLMGLKQPTCGWGFSRAVRVPFLSEHVHRVKPFLRLETDLMIIFEDLNPVSIKSNQIRKNLYFCWHAM